MAAVFSFTTKLRLFTPTVSKTRNFVFFGTTQFFQYPSRVLRHPDRASRQFAAPVNTLAGSSPNVTMLALKRRPAKKKKVVEDIPKVGHGKVSAFSTAEEYTLENLIKGLANQNLYRCTDFSKELGNADDVVHCTANYETNAEPREIFFFRDGSVVFWNFSEIESLNVLEFLKAFQIGSFNVNLINDEADCMEYMLSTDKFKTNLQEDVIVFSKVGPLLLEKYAISNAIAQSVRLGVWEGTLEQYVESMEDVTDDLKSGRKIRMSREGVLRKTGELLALRHAINLSGDLLDTPDFYWDRDELESLYLRLINYLCIARRTKVINDKLNHCLELVELLSSHLNDKHHVRLEWMIILLIMVEVGFEILHYLDRLVISKGDIQENKELPLQH